MHMAKLRWSVSVDVITIAATGSGKSLYYWMVLLYVRYGIVFGIVVGFEDGKDL